MRHRFTRDARRANCGDQVSVVQNESFCFTITSSLSRPRLFSTRKRSRFLITDSSSFDLFSEREGTTNKPRRARHWLTRRCGRCLSNTDSIRSSMSSIAQYMPETPTHNSTQNLSSGTDSNERNSQLCTVVNLSSSQGQLEGDCISLQELRTDSEIRASSASLRSVSSQGYMSPYEERKSYTHQVVVVAPITGKLFFLLFSDPGCSKAG